MTTPQLGYLHRKYRRGSPGAGIEADLIEPGPNGETLPADVLPPTHALPAGTDRQVLVNDNGNWQAGQVETEGLADMAVDRTKVADWGIVGRHINQADDSDVPGVLTDLLERQTGNERLAGSAVRNLAGEIDTELGSNAWRTGGGGTSVGLTASQVDARIALEAVRNVTALPSPVVFNQVILIRSTGDHYLGTTVPAGSYDVTLTPAGTDNVGYDRASHQGSIQPDRDWIDRVWHDSEAQRVVVYIRSTTDPGTVTLNVPGAGNFPLTFVAASGIDRTYQSARAVVSPFTAGTAVTVTLTITGIADHWARLDLNQAVAAATWAQAGNTEPFPIAKFPPNYPTGLATGTPLAPVAGGNVGVDTKAARDDHQHPLQEVEVPALSDTAPGNTPGSPSAGTSLDSSRSDHDHGITPGTGGGGGGISNQELTQAIAQHTAVPNAHHTPPSVPNVADWTGQAAADMPFARDRLPLATTTEPGAISAADQTQVERLSRIPTPDTENIGELLGVNASNDYALVGVNAILPRRLRDFGADLLGDGYVLQPMAVARSRSNTAYTLALATPLEYADFYGPSPRIANSHYAFRLPAGTSLVGAELRIGEQDGVTELENRLPLQPAPADLTSLGMQGAWDYYDIQVADVPEGDALTIVILQKIGIPFDKVDPRNLMANQIGGLPHSAVGTLHTGAGTGVTVVSSDTTRRIGLQLFDPAFDLTDAENQAGVFAVSGLLTLTGRAQTSIGFDTDTADPQLEQEFTAITFSSVLRATTAFAANMQHGHLVAEYPIMNGSGTLGTYKLYLAYDSTTNNLGYYGVVEAGGGSLGYTVALSDLEVGFIHTDTGVSSDGYQHLQVTQAAYDAIGAGRPATTIYLVAG